jgi:hypothetical protein
MEGYGPDTGKIKVTRSAKKGKFAWIQSNYIRFIFNAHYLKKSRSNINLLYLSVILYRFYG